jgi:hypothetical protein
MRQAICVLALLVACDGTSPSIGVDIAAAPLAVKRTESVNVTVTAVNISARVVRLRSPRYICGWRPFEVFDPLGRTVELVGEGCLAVAYDDVELHPGESVEYRSTWMPAMSIVDGDPAVAGSYRLVGSLMPDDHEHVRSSALIEVTP